MSQKDQLLIRQLCWGVLLFGLAIPCGQVLGSEITAPAIDFGRDIRPLLSDNCFSCHGPDEESREADLRLDVMEEALADRGDYFVISAGNPQESELWSRVSSEDPDEMMPPPDSQKQLTGAQKELLRRWIADGAEWQGHWAFVAPQRPEVPKLEQSSSNPLDQFVKVQLQEHGISFSPAADRRTLARRLALDLTGLPASPDRVEAFVASTEEDAYATLVDEYLSSPHYGERMAMFWLDLVRYADTNGIHGDNYRPHSPYRDYVINAFNENMPFDQFTREQLAGDLLPDATKSQKIASGYNRLNLTTREGGAQPKEYMAMYAADRVRNTASVWLGITMGCCECHDHKFDPYTTREFYEFEAFFADLEEIPVGPQPPTNLPVGEDARTVAQLQQQKALLEAKLQEPSPELDAAQAVWEESVSVDKTDWAVLTSEKALSEQGSVIRVLPDGSLLSTGGHNPPTDTYNLEMKTHLQGITALRLEMLPDDSLPARGPGRAFNGNFVLRELIVSVDGISPLPLLDATATYSQEGWPVAASIDGDGGTGWAVAGRLGQLSSAIFRFKNPIPGGPNTTLKFRIEQNHGEAHTLGRFRLAVTNSIGRLAADKFTDLPLEIAEIFRKAPASRSETEKLQLITYFRKTTPLLEQEHKQIADLKRKIDQINQRGAILISISGEPREMKVLPKGDWLNESGDVVQPGVPACLPELGINDRRATRLDLANWLVRDDNPLVARVLVNRLWRLLFGQALVTSLDDFGSQGTWPSHPALLDWLATEMVESGWDTKHMLRLLAMSQCYQQASFADQQQLHRDPSNRWLGRQGRFRLDAEWVRDNALAVSGLLSLDIGGPSVKPYQPTGYWHHLNFPRRTYKPDTGTNLYRRGLYTHWQRTFLHPSLSAFDAPTRETCTTRRSRSNTPMQALVLLNDSTYVEAARVLAERMVRAGDGDANKTLQFAFRQVLARPATREEIASLTGLYQQHHRQYESDVSAATDLVGIGETPVPQDINPSELAAWTSVARVLLNLHETITRY